MMMAISRKTLKLARGMRIQLGRNVDAATRDLTRAWGAAWNEIASEFEAAIGDLIAASRNGRWPSRRTINRATRAQQALAAAAEALQQLSATTDVRILQSLRTVPTEAAIWQAELIASQMPPTSGHLTLGVTFHRVDPYALSAIVQRSTQQVTALTRPLSVEATAAMRTSLIRGVALGEHPNVAAREMLKRVKGDFFGGLTRAKTIARTEMLDAHRAAAMAQDLANPDTVTGWQWLATLDKRTCPSCLSQHGNTYPPTTPGPDDHQQGRCARIPVTKTWAELGITGVKEPPSVMRDAQAWFNDQPETIQLQIMGPSRLAKLNDGTATWADLAQKRTTRGWRDSYAPTPVSQLGKAS